MDGFMKQPVLKEYRSICTDFRGMAGKSALRLGWYPRYAQ